MMHGHEKSRSAIVAVKPTNKVERPAAEQSAAAPTAAEFRSEGKRWGRPPIAPALEKRIREALNKPGRTEGVRKIAARFGVDPSTVQRISRPFEGASVAVA
jgi:DNA invertase Pin-like site-specific DNA recombinase